MSKNLKIIVASIGLVFFGLVVALGWNIVHLTSLSSNEAKLTKQVKTLKKERDALADEYDRSKDDVEAMSGVTFEEVTGFKKARIDRDDQIVTDFLNTIFTWTNGAQYDKQRDEIMNSGITGAKELTETLMMENYRVEVPDDLSENLRKKLEKLSNDIDVNGIKSKLVTTRLVRTSWTDDGDVTYAVNVRYQVYVNERDLTGKNKTTRDLVFTIKLTGRAADRKIDSVTYAYVN